MEKILITIKFYSGIEKELTIENYDMVNGVVFSVNHGTRLGKILHGTGLKKLSRFCFFSNGVRISTWTRFYKPSEISCLKMSGGG